MMVLRYAVDGGFGHFEGRENVTMYQLTLTNMRWRYEAHKMDLLKTFMFLPEINDGHVNEDFD